MPVTSSRITTQRLLRSALAAVDRRTLAELDLRDTIRVAHVIDAIQYRRRAGTYHSGPRLAVKPSCSSTDRTKAIPDSVVNSPVPKAAKTLLPVWIGTGKRGIGSCLRWPGPRWGCVAAIAYRWTRPSNNLRELRRLMASVRPKFLKEG